MTRELIIQMAGITIAGLGTLVLTLLTWGVKVLITTVIDTNKELAVIKEQLRTLFDDTSSIPKIKEDLNVLHRWRKETQNEGNENVRG